jgi:hypothetical protein
VAVAGVGFALWTRRSVVGASTEAERIAALESRVALLEARLRLSGGRSRLGGGSEPHLVVPAPGPVPSTDTEAPAEAATAKTVARPVELNEAALRQAYFGELDARLASESRDPVWAVATEEKLRGSAQDLRPRIDIEGAQCGQTLCRVEALVPEPRDEAVALNQFVSASLGALPEAVIRDGDGPGRHVVYFARKGNEFPPMEPPPEGLSP